MLRLDGERRLPRKHCHLHRMSVRRVRWMHARLARATEIFEKETKFHAWSQPPSSLGRRWFADTVPPQLRAWQAVFSKSCAAWEVVQAQRTINANLVDNPRVCSISILANDTSPADAVYNWLVYALKPPTERRRCQYGHHQTSSFLRCELGPMSVSYIWWRMKYT